LIEAELRNRLLHDPVPGEQEAGRRAWEVVRSSYASRERVPWIERHSRLVLVLAVAAAVGVAAVTPPGRALVDRMRDSVAGRTPSEPALTRLPTSGRLLVVSASGPWVVHQDGSKRFLGEYGDASWSPRGLFVAAVQQNRLVTLDPESGKVRWSLSRAAPVKDPRWSGGGLDTRIAYRAQSSLHVVAGDGSPDALLADDVAPVAPVWKGETHVLAYATRDGRVHVVDVDTRQELWSASVRSAVRKLLWSESGRRLIVLTGRAVRVYGPSGRRVPGPLTLPQGHLLLDAAVLPKGWFVYADFNPRTDETALIQATCITTSACPLIGPSRLLSEPGRLENFVVSPDGRWLLVGWPAADQILFLRPPDTPGRRRIVPVSNVSREFDPGGTGTRAFPRAAGWVGDSTS
jgi:hypothetical protein